MKKLKTVLALSGLLLASTSWADAPAQVKQQVPGYYRLAVGEYEVTALFDGYNDLSPALLHGLSGDKVRELAGRTWDATRKTERVGHTVVLKLKTAQFRILTRSFTPEVAPQSRDEFLVIALALLDRVDLPVTTRYRLVGVGIAGFREPDEISQRELFPAAAAPRGSDT